MHRQIVEQPCPTVEDLAALRRRLDVPIAADESIRRVGDPMRVKDLAAADIAVLKVQPLGGVHACLRLVEELDLPVVFSRRSIGQLDQAISRLDAPTALASMQ